MESPNDSALLRQYFLKRGVSSASAIIAGAMSAHSVQAAPTGLASSVTAVAVAKGAAASTSTLTLIKGALKIMAWTKAKTAVIVGVTTLAGLSVTTVAVKQWEHPKHYLKPAAKSYPYPGDWIWQPNANGHNFDLVPPLLLLRPTQRPASWVPFDMYGDNRYLAEGKTIGELLTAIKNQRNSEAKITLPPDLPEDKYDCIVTLQTNWVDALETEFDQRLNLTTRIEYLDGKSVMIVKWAQE